MVDTMQPPPDVVAPDDDGGDDDFDPAPDRRPSWPQIVLLAFACAFAGGAAVYWWEHRPARPNAADIGFYDDMTVHHEQAIDMALTYLRHGDDRVLRHMADEIVLFQAGDIRTMQTALSDWNAHPNDDVAMSWMGTPVRESAQPGMATTAELRALARARGRALDDRFSQLMIRHHAGGAHMADAEVRLGRDHGEQTWARKMAAAQRLEIDELNRARQRLGLPLVRPVIG